MTSGPEQSPSTEYVSSNSAGLFSVDVPTLLTEDVTVELALVVGT